MLWGDLLAVASGAVWGANTVVIRVSKVGTAPATHSLFYQLASGFVLLTGYAVVTGNAGFTPSTPLVLNLVFQTLIVSFFSFFIWFWLLTRYKASQLGVYSFVTPVFGVALGYVLLDEPLSVEFLVGSAGVIAGITIVSVYPWIRGKRRKRDETAVISAADA